MEDLTQEQLEAINPDTPLARLQTIAQESPELCPLLALNPSTYPDLLDWLAELQDTQVDDALAKRAELEQRGELENYAAACISSIAEASESPVSPETPDSQPAALPPSEEPQPLQTPDFPASEEPELSPGELELHRNESSAAAAAAAEMAAMNRVNQANQAVTANFIPDLSSPAAAKYSTTTKLCNRLSNSDKTTSGRFNHFWLFMILGLLIWLVVIVLVVWGFTNNAHKPISMSSAQAAEPTPSVTATPQELTQNGLPEGYTGPTKTIEVPGAKPGETIRRVVPDDSAHASASASPTPSPTPTNPLAAPANAKKLNSFTTADGNVRCIFGGSQVQCFANSTDPYYCSTQARNTGYSDVLYASHSRGHEFSCIEPIDTATEGTLGANESVTNGTFACQASKTGNRVVCWNTSAGDGIVVGSDMAARFGKGKYVPSQWDK